MEHRAHQTYKRAFTSATWISNLPSTSKTDSMLELPTVYCGLSMGSLTLPQTSARSILLMGTFVRTSKLLAPTEVTLRFPRPLVKLIPTVGFGSCPEGKRL